MPTRQSTPPMINIKGLDFWVLEINDEQQLMNISRVDLKENMCAPKLVNTTLDYNFFDFQNQSNKNLTLHYNCSTGSSSGLGFTCNGTYGFMTIDGEPNDESSCEVVVKVPVRADFVDEVGNGKRTLIGGLEAGFTVEYLKNDEMNCGDCRNSGGICGSDQNTIEFSCLCPEGPNRFRCQPRMEGTF